MTMKDVDFSRVNLQYLIGARDLARASPQRAAVLLGIPDRLAQRLAELSAEELAAERGLVPVPPFDDPQIAAGQGTAALELLEDAPDLDAVITPVGGGGLLSGTALATAGLSPAEIAISIMAEMTERLRRPATRPGRRP